MGIQNRLWAIFLLGYVEKSTSADHIIWASPPNTQVFGYSYFGYCSCFSDRITPQLSPIPLEKCQNLTQVRSAIGHIGETSGQVGDTSSGQR